MLYLLKKIFYWSIVDLRWEATPPNPDLDFVLYETGGDDMSAATCGRQKGEAWAFLKKMALNRWGPAWGWEEPVCYLHCRRINSTSGLWLFPATPQSPANFSPALAGWAWVFTGLLAPGTPDAVRWPVSWGHMTLPPWLPRNATAERSPPCAECGPGTSSHGPRLNRTQGLAPAWEAVDDLFSLSDISSASSPLVCVGLGWGWGKDV